MLFYEIPAFILKLFFSQKLQEARKLPEALGTLRPAAFCFRGRDIITALQQRVKRAVRIAQSRWRACHGKHRLTLGHLQVPAGHLLLQGGVEFYEAVREKPGRQCLWFSCLWLDTFRTALGNLIRGSSNPGMGLTVEKKVGVLTTQAPQGVTRYRHLQVCAAPVTTSVSPTGCSEGGALGLS